MSDELLSRLSVYRHVAFVDEVLIPVELVKLAYLEIATAKREAECLARSIWRHHYQDTAPNWEVLGNASSIITQIDNMTAGLSRQIKELRKENARLAAVLDGAGVTLKDNGGWEWTQE